MIKHIDEYITEKDYNNSEDNYLLELNNIIEELKN
jgi:hypothetical protein